MNNSGSICEIARSCSGVKKRRSINILSCLGIAGASLVVGCGSQGGEDTGTVASSSAALTGAAAVTSTEVQYDLSQPLRAIAPKLASSARRLVPLLLPHPATALGRSGVAAQAANDVAGPLAITTGVSVEGIGQGFTGPAGTYSVSSAPSDSNGAAGPSHYMEIVNTAIAVFNKSGTPVF